MYTHILLIFSFIFYVERPPNQALYDALCLLNDEFDTNFDPEPLNIKEELSGRLHPKGRFIIERGYLERMAEGSLDRGNLNGEGFNLTLQLGRKVLTLCSIFILDTGYVSTLCATAHTFFSAATTFSSRYTRDAPNVAFFTDFKNAAGFDRIKRRICDKRRPLSVSDMRHIFTLINDAPLAPEERLTTAEELLRLLEPRLLGITAADLQAEPRGASTELLRTMGALLLRGAGRDPELRGLHMHAALHVAGLLIDFAGVFEKKLTGLREVCAWGKDGEDIALEGEVAAWVREQHILQRVLKDTSVHAEFVRSVRDIIALEARKMQLGDEDIDLIWRFCTAAGGSDAGDTTTTTTTTTAAAENRHIMLENIAAVSKDFGEATFCAFEERFASLPDNVFFGDSAVFITVCTFVANELCTDGVKERNRKYTSTYLEKTRKMIADEENGDGDSAKIEEHRKREAHLSNKLAELGFSVPYRCLDRMWAAMLDGSPAVASAAAEARVATGVAGTFAGTGDKCPSVYARYQGLAVANLREHRSVWQSLHFLVHSVPSKSEGKHQKMYYEVLGELNAKEHLLDAFVDECAAFKEAAKAAGVSDDTAVLPGLRAPYAKQVAERLGFAETLISNCKTITLGCKEVGALWDMFVGGALTRSEVSKVLGFFSTIAQNSGEVFDKETSRFLFPGKAETFDFRRVSNIEYEFINYFFMFSNWKEGIYTQDPSNRNIWFITDYLGLIGIEVLWRVALEAEDEAVGSKAVDTIFGYFSSLAPAEAANVLTYKEHALDRCLNVLSEEVAKKPPETVYTVRVVRALTFIRKILEGFEVQDPHNELFKIIAACKNKNKGNKNGKKTKKNKKDEEKATATTTTTAGTGTDGAMEVVPSVEGSITLTVKFINSQSFVLEDVSKSSTLSDVTERLAREHPDFKKDCRYVSKGIHLDTAKTIQNILTELDLSEESALTIFSVPFSKKAAGELATASTTPGVGGVGGATAKGSKVAKPSLPASSSVLQEASYATFGRVLALPTIASGACLRVLDLLPTDPSLQNVLDSVATTADGDAVNWSAVIPSEGSRKLAYVLPVLIKYLYASDEGEDSVDEEEEKKEESIVESKAQAWRNAFVGKNGGIKYIVKAFCGMNYDSLHAADKAEELDKAHACIDDGKLSPSHVKWSYTLSGAAEVIAWCAKNGGEAQLLRANGEEEEEEEAGSALFTQLLRVTENLAHSYVPYDFSAGASTAMFHNCTATFAALLRSSEPTVCAAVNTFLTGNSDAVLGWIRTALVDCSCANFRKEAEDFTLAFAEHKNSNEKDSSLGKVIARFLVQMLPEVAKCTKAGLENYFNVLDKLLLTAATSAAAHDSEIDVNRLFKQVTVFIRARPVTEENFGRGEYGADCVLQGLLRLAATLAPHISCREEEKKKEEECERMREELFWEVFKDCLFAAPTAEAKEYVPKCKKERSRQLAYDLLLALLGAGLPEGFAAGPLAAAVEERTENVDMDDLSRGAFFADGTVRAARGYSGLYNQGATCYMNSTLQQFFMTPEFRRALLEINTDELDAKKANVPFLRALQRLFLNMQESQRVAQKTKMFTKTLGPDFKSYVQMDAIEFLGNLVGNVENAVKGTRFKPIADIFTAKMCDEMIPRGCPHVRENVSESTTIQIDVKGKRSLEESLANWVRGELLEGDNKCTCEACGGEKRDTLKRPCFLETPPMLIFHLRRFEFSYETFTNFKVNDEFHFPFTLSLHPYTKKGLHEKDNNNNNGDDVDMHKDESEEKDETIAATKKTESAEDNNNNNNNNEDDDNVYELVGVVAHRGTTNSGHYYSFIKERTKEGKWFEFNDSTVEPFSTDRIPDQCFGGMETRFHKGMGVTPKTNNAYILFYKKRSWDSSEERARAADPEGLCDNAKDAYEKVWSDNERFISSIDACDSSFVDFVKKAFVVPNVVNKHTIQVAQKVLFDILPHVPNSSGLLPSYKPTSAAATSTLQNDDDNFMRDINAMDVEDDTATPATPTGNENSTATTTAETTTEEKKEEEEEEKKKKKINNNNNYTVFTEYIKRAFRENVELALEFVTSVQDAFNDEDDDGWYFTSRLLESPNVEVRKAVVDVTYTALVCLANSDNNDHKTTAGMLIYTIVSMMKDDTVEVNWKTYAEYFHLLTLIATGGGYSSNRSNSSATGDYHDAEIARGVLGAMESAKIAEHLAALCFNDVEDQRREGLKEITTVMKDKYSKMDVEPVAKAAAAFLRAAITLGVPTQGTRLFTIPTLCSKIFSYEDCYTGMARIADGFCSGGNGDSEANAVQTREYVAVTLRDIFSDFYDTNTKIKLQDLISMVEEAFAAFKTEFVLAPGHPQATAELRGEALAEMLFTLGVDYIEERNILEAFLTAAYKVLPDVPGVRTWALANVSVWVLGFLCRVKRQKCRDEGYALLMKLLAVPEKSLTGPLTQPPLLLHHSGEDEGDNDKATASAVRSIFTFVLQGVDSMIKATSATKEALRPVRPIPMVKTLYQTLRYEDQAKALFASEHYKGLISLLRMLCSYSPKNVTTAKYTIIRTIHEAMVADPTATAEDVCLEDIKEIVNSWTVAFCAPAAAANESQTCDMLRDFLAFVGYLDHRFSAEAPILKYESDTFARLCEHIVLSPAYAAVKPLFERFLPAAVVGSEDYSIFVGVILERCLSQQQQQHYEDDDDDDDDIEDISFDAALDVFENDAAFAELTRTEDNSNDAKNNLLRFFLKALTKDNIRNARLHAFIQRVLDAETSTEDYEALAVSIPTLVLTAELSEDRAEDKEALANLTSIWLTLLRKDPEGPIAENLEKKLVYTTQKYQYASKAFLVTVCDAMVNDIIIAERSARHPTAVCAAARIAALLSVVLDSDKYVDVLCSEACRQGLENVDYGIAVIRQLLTNWALLVGKDPSASRTFCLIADSGFGTHSDSPKLAEWVNVVMSHITVMTNNTFGPIPALVKIRIVFASSEALARIFADREPEFVSKLVNYLKSIGSLSRSEEADVLAKCIFHTMEKFGIVKAESESGSETEPFSSDDIDDDDDDDI